MNNAHAYDLWRTTPPDDDDHAERQAHEDACKDALDEYMADGDLPDGKDSGHVWEALGEEDEGEVACGLLKAWREDDDAEMLAIAKRAGQKLDRIVLGMIERGLE